MTQHCDDEFRTIDLLAASDCKSLGVDAFCLSWIKYERQLRKLVAYLVFQSSALSNANTKELRQALYENTGIAHTNTRDAIRRLTGESASALVGDRYRHLNRSIQKSFEARQKIFHGQQTDKSLSRPNLISMSADLREWCERLSDAADHAFGYDGFSGTTSLFKGDRPALTTRVDREIGNDWKAFVRSL